jgi:hypothetical protein
VSGRDGGGEEELEVAALLREGGAARLRRESERKRDGSAEP